MKILIPMAGNGQRFADADYQISKPVISTIDRVTGRQYPMVVCATKDLPGVNPDGSNIIYVDRDFHKADGVEEMIKEHYPKAKFITVDRLTQGQASTCLLAKEYIDCDEPLLIAGCDNGMDFDYKKFCLMAKKTDVLVFTYRNDESVLVNPDAYGWMLTDEKGRITGTSIKKAISNNPMKDHAVVATFWFSKGRIFIQAAEKMIAENDRINGEFYVDQVIRHVLDLGYRANIFEIDRYIGWGTPTDYETYTKTYHYWKGFALENEYCRNIFGRNNED